MTKPVLRRSEVAALLGCARWQPDVSGPEAKGGLLTHDLIKRWWDNPLDFDIDQEYAEASLSPEVRGLTDEQRADARAVFERFLATHGHMDVPDLYEQRLTWETEDAILAGIPDAIWQCPESTLLIVDYKRSWMVTADSFQLMFYAALALHFYDALGLTWQRVVARIDPLRAGDSGVIEWTWERDDILAWFEREVIAQVPRLLAERDTAEPTGGRSCEYCRLRMSCPLAIAPWRDVPATDDDAAAMVGEMVRLEAGIAERKAALRQWFADRPPTEVNGLEVGFLTPREQRFLATADPRTIADWLTEHSYSGDAVLAVKSAAIGRPLARELVEAGLGAMVTGEAEFKTRKAAK